VTLGRVTYVVWIVAWALPILGLHWALGWRRLVVRRRGTLGAAAVTTAYLTVVDAVAIRAGVWVFSPDLTLGLALGPVPLEEILFFWVTSLMVAQTMALFDRRRLFPL
jgi:lycopene cyclase domain-containing protein